jgi:RNA polymerase sigma factor (sigma-70 family)
VWPIAGSVRVDWSRRRETPVEHEWKSWHSPDNQQRSDFEAFVKDNHSFLLPVARRYAGLRGLPDPTVSDIVQEAMCITWRAWATKLASADGDRRRAFVCTTMSNVAQAEQRGQRRAGRVTEPSALIDLAAPQASHEDGVLTQVALRVLRDALATLPDEERLILDLAIADLPRAQIADQLGLTATNVTTKLHRARDGSAGSSALTCSPNWAWGAMGTRREVPHEHPPRRGDEPSIGGAA